MRIIAGSAKGRQISALSGLATRPTLDRVKEAVFGSIQFDLPGSRVLDLFSGSGNLGLEAASRGAGFVVCNDVSSACAQQIRKNAISVGLAEHILVLQYDYLEAINHLAKQNQVFDFVFLDPPYASDFAVQAAEKLFTNGMIAQDGLVVIEHAASDDPPKDIAGIMRRKRTRKFGACAVSEMESDKNA